LFAVFQRTRFFECIRDFFPKASAKVRTFYGLAKYFKNFFAGKCSFFRLSDRNQGKTPFYYYVRAIKGRKKHEKAWDHGGKTAVHRRSGKEGGRGGLETRKGRGGKTGGGMEKAERGGPDNFWYSFSVGFMGVMLASVPAMILVMPLLIYQKRQQMQENSGA